MQLIHSPAARISGLCGAWQRAPLEGDFYFGIALDVLVYILVWFEFEGGVH
jgi:hypothetical protein